MQRNCYTNHYLANVRYASTSLQWLLPLETAENISQFCTTPLVVTRSNILYEYFICSPATNPGKYPGSKKASQKSVRTNNLLRIVLQIRVPYLTQWLPAMHSCAASSHGRGWLCNIITSLRFFISGVQVHNITYIGIIRRILVSDVSHVLFIT